MGKQRNVDPGRRKRPKRRTGQAIVDAVVEATERLLAQDGLAGLTTKRIAKVAGVSSGSIYQYFESKQGIVAELARRLEQRARDLAFEKLQGIPPSEMSAVIRIFVGVLVEESLGHQQMRRSLIREVPRAWIETNSAVVDEEVQAFVQRVIAEAPQAREGSPEMMAFVVHHAVEAVVEAAVLRHPEWLGDEAFQRELARLAECYLSR
ncbi:MAG: TetR/AcrR family transcriptional regulator [Myxococcota bacterium]